MPCYLSYKLVALAVASLASMCLVQSDPLNLVKDGDFDEMSLNLTPLSPFFNVFSSSPESTGSIFGWIVSSGGVQIVSNQVYYSEDSSSKYCVHLNSPAGPGLLRSIPLSLPRPGASYDVSYKITVNPDGGPLWRSMTVSMQEGNRVYSSPAVSVSDPLATRSALTWSTQQFSFIGMGQVASLKFQSTTAGFYGLLIDSVQVSLSNLIDNGGFEFGSLNVSQLSNNSYCIIRAPSTDIWEWLVISGSVKYVKGQYNSSVKGSLVVIDLNGDGEGSLMTSFVTRAGLSYTVLFDMMMNSQGGSARSDGGLMRVRMINTNDGKVIASEIITQELSGGEWRTCELTSIAVGAYVNVTFTSLVKGRFGPLLDNVQVFEVHANVSMVYPFLSESHLNRSFIFTAAWFAVLSIIGVVFFV